MGIARSAAKLLFAGTDLLLESMAGPRILIYHQVGSGLGRQMEVTVPAFSSQMTWLAENRQVVSLERAIERWGADESDQLVALTFDDGFLDTYTTAYPMLSELGFPFTLYLTTDPIETGLPFSAVPGAEPLRWEQVSEMMGSGLLTVGSHTHTHPDLRDLTPDLVRSELEVSDRIIESRLGVKPAHFAYPYGFWARSADGLVRERYQSAVVGGTSRPDASPDRAAIHRYPVQLSDGFVFFKRRLKRGMRLEEAVRRQIKGYDGP